MTGVHIAGAFEHPTRKAPDTSTPQLHAEVASGALADAGLAAADVDGYLTAGPPGDRFPAVTMADYLGLEPTFVDSTDIGGASYIAHVGHAANAIARGDCEVALTTLAGRPRSRGDAPGTGTSRRRSAPGDFEALYGATHLLKAGLSARRHMAAFGTTERQLAAIRVAASRHASHNPHARYPEPVTVDDVLESRALADPIKLLDCCVVTDGGGAVVIVSDDVRSGLDRECVEVLGHGEAVGHQRGGRVDVTTTASRRSGSRAYRMAGVGPEAVDYASIYDSFTITALLCIEDLGFCEKGAGGEFVQGGTLQAPDGRLPVNTDGGSLCSNHPGNRGGMTKVIEAVRQLRGEANAGTQVDGAEVAVAHGVGGDGTATRHGAATVVLGRER